MNASEDRVHFYHADASPFGGLLSHPFERVLPSHASVALSQAGGHAAARIENFHLDELIQIGAAYSRVAGSVEKSNGNWTTLVTSVVEDLNVLQVVTAERIVAQLSIEHPRRGYFPKISFAGSQFHNLRVNGRAVEAHVDHHFLAAPREKGLSRSDVQEDILHTGQAASAPLIEFPGKPWPEVESFTAKAADQKHNMTSLPGAPDWIKNRYKRTDALADRGGPGHVACSLVQKIEGGAPGTCFGHVMHVHGFGNLFLGELQVSHHVFSLTMLRIEMGCAAGGHISFASGGGNGHSMP